MKKKIYMLKDHLDSVINDINLGTLTYSSEDTEEDVDDAVKALLKPVYGDRYIKGKKTGIRNIDSKIPAYHGESGTGKPDVMIFNVFGNSEIDVVVEDKSFVSTEDPTPQAEHYASVGEVLSKPIRVIIGNHPRKKLVVKVKVDNKYLPLKINGKEIHSFFGKNVLKMIYDNPNVNEFVLDEYIEKPFTQKDFHRLVNNLKVQYRQIPEIGNNDDLSINFTVSYIALKMIMEKQNIDWDSISNVQNLIDQIDNIVGLTANSDLKNKYYDVFCIFDKKTNNETFNFLKVVKSIDTREKQEKRTTRTDTTASALISIHNIISEIPNKDLSIDLFGEVYECLASKKTKKMLGEFFTRRHIINAIVKMFLTENDIEDIVKHKKTIADPACGTGGFLTESFKYIKEYCNKYYPSIDTSDLANQIIVGYDINPNNIGRTRINMTLAGDGFSDISRQDSLRSTELANDIDYILTNVPYGAGDYAVNDISSNDEFLKSNNNKRLELNFAIKVIQLLKKGGRAAVILPEGLLEAQSLSDFRLFLLKQCKIDAIISLPKFAFAPYTKWKTYVLFLEKRAHSLDTIEDILNKNEKTWCYIVDNDGYANSDKRFATDLRNEDNSYKHNELSEYLDTDGTIQSALILKRYEQLSEDTVKSYLNEWNNEIKGKKYGFITINDICEKQIVQYASLTQAEVNNRLKSEANCQTLLSDEDYDSLLNSIRFTSRGYNVKKEDYIEDGFLKEEFIPIFESLNIEYDADSNKFYDISQENIVYLLPLIPERYFRKREVVYCNIDDLKNLVSDIENDLENIKR